MQSASSKVDEVEFRESQSSLAREQEVLGRTCDRLKLERGHLLRENIALTQNLNQITENQVHLIFFSMLATLQVHRLSYCLILQMHRTYFVDLKSNFSLF